MAWVFLEVALAFGIAIGIVWWTFPKKKRPQDRLAEAQAAEVKEAAAATPGADRKDEKA